MNRNGLAPQPEQTVHTRGGFKPMTESRTERLGPGSAIRSRGKKPKDTNARMRKDANQPVPPPTATRTYTATGNKDSVQPRQQSRARRNPNTPKG